MKNITIVGSINVDTTLRVAKQPKIGETIHVHEQIISGGGKGANQAVAAARSGAHVTFIGAIGHDSEGRMMIDLLNDEQIDTSPIEQVDAFTGHAFISVDNEGHNCIMIDAGANHYVDASLIQRNKEIIQQSEMIIGQLECHMEGTIEAFRIAKQNNVMTLLNPAPATHIPDVLLQNTDVIVPNETEAETLTGIEVTDEISMRNIANYFHQKGVRCVIITLGERGAFYDIDGKYGIVPAYTVQAKDTTAAGDTFIGALSTRLQADFLNLVADINYANCASSLAVQVFGAQPSIPDQEMVLEKLH